MLYYTENHSTLLCKKYLFQTIYKAGTGQIFGNKSFIFGSKGGYNSDSIWQAYFIIMFLVLDISLSSACTHEKLHFI